MLRVILSGLKARRARLARTAIAVVMGVAFVAGTYVFTDTLDRMFNGIVDQSTQGVDVYVRDRGPGFSLDDVPGDRLGVRESIIGRLRRVGGTATVKPGAGGIGTEVHLHFAGEEARRG